MVTEGHGTALDRITAFQVGFVQGQSACARIDLDEVSQAPRRPADRARHRPGGQPTDR